MTTRYVHQTGAEEWWTPIHVISAVRSVFGRIDLDPASCAAANETIKADNFFDREANGLTLAWYGNVFVNPPYARGVIDRWAAAAVDNYRTDPDLSIIWLSNNCTETRWCQLVMERAAMVCFPSHRMAFRERGRGGGAKAMQGQVLMLLSKSRRYADNFRFEFSKLGPVFERI